MSLSTAQQFAWSLATTLMVAVTLFRAETGYGVLPSAEFDPAAGELIHDYDPFEIMYSRTRSRPIA